MEGRQDEELGRLREIPSLTSWQESFLEGSDTPSQEEEAEEEIEFDDESVDSGSGGQVEDHEDSELSTEEDSSEISDTTDGNSSETSETMPDTTENEVEIGGVKIKLAVAAKNTEVEDTPMFKKDKRKEMSEDKRNDLFDKATKNVLTKFDLLSLSIKDEDKLDDTYNLHILIAKMKAHMIKYDMHDVFQILTVAEDGKKVSDPKSLFSNYSTISEADVAKSNRWYATWPEAGTYRENLQLTYQFLENNTTERLWDKCLEVYEQYPAQERGGPLMFVIIMKKLQVDTDAAVEYLRNSVKMMKITNFDGEDVSRVVSLIRGAWKRLKGVGESKVPTDFSKQIASVLQTSSVPEFNAIFEHLTNMVEIKARLEPGKDQWPKPDVLLEMAESKYLELHHIDKWTGATTKVNQSIFFQSTGGKIKCFNCLGDHPLSKCTKPKNDKLIEQRRNEFNKEKEKTNKNNTANGATNNNNNKSGDGNRSSGGGNNKGKWAPPTPQEKNRRTIDGKPYKYSPKKKRWYKDRSKGAANPGSPQANAAANVAATPDVAAPAAAATPVTPPNDAAKDALRNAALQNASHAVNLAMRGLVAAYQE
jgi:hypothetical protein